MASPAAFSQQIAIRPQVAAAVAGFPALSLPEDADGWSLFAAQAPVDYGGALRHSAYFQAVAARLLGDGTLAQSAAWTAVKATPYVAATTSAAPADMAAELNAAADAIGQAFKRKGSSAKAAGAVRIMALLKQQAAPAAIQKAQEEDEGPIAALRKLQKDLGEITRVALFAAKLTVAALVAAGAYFVYRRIR